jgi:hypothetical protein
MSIIGPFSKNLRAWSVMKEDVTLHVLTADPELCGIYTQNKIVHVVSSLEMVNESLYWNEGIKILKSNDRYMNRLNIRY